MRLSVVHAGYVIFSGERFMARGHARTELDLQGGRRRLWRLDILRGLLLGYGSWPPLLGGYLISLCFHDSRAIPFLGYHIQQTCCLHLSLFTRVLPGLGNAAEEIVLSTRDGQQSVRLADALLFQGCGTVSRPFDHTLDYWEGLDLAQRIHF